MMKIIEELSKPAKMGLNQHELKTLEELLFIKSNLGQKQYMLEQLRKNIASCLNRCGELEGEDEM